jgi:hypothetical protein
MTKKSKHLLDSIRLEGNKGGDYIEIHEREDGRIHLKVGHNCLVTIDHIVPVEFLTLILGGMTMSHNPVDLLSKLEKKYGIHVWDAKYMAQLVSQIEPARNFTDLSNE